MAALYLKEGSNTTRMHTRTNTTRMHTRTNPTRDPSRPSNRLMCASLLLLWKTRAKELTPRYVILSRDVQVCLLPSHAVLTPSPRSHLDSTTQACLLTVS